MLYLKYVILQLKFQFRQFPYLDLLFLYHVKKLYHVQLLRIQNEEILLLEIGLHQFYLQQKRAEQGHFYHVNQ